jgi:putative oxidoreductase
MLSSTEMLTLLRVLLGVLFMAHGAHKLFGWFGSHGLHAHAYDLAAIGMRRAKTWTRISALLELVGGGLLSTGLLTPFAAALVVIPRIVTIVSVSQGKGFWNTRGGCEYSVVLALLALLIALAGPGPVSVDALLTYAWPYKTALVVSLVVAALGSVVAITATSPRRYPTSSQTT